MIQTRLRYQPAQAEAVRCDGRSRCWLPSRSASKSAKLLLKSRKLAWRSSRAALPSQQTRRQRCVCKADQSLATYDGVVLPTKMNTVPHPREMRQFFYKEVCDAVTLAVNAGEKRMRVRATIPELNVEMDVYRIGTLLEMVRELATCLAADGQRVKVCVQQALGQGVFQGTPLSLSGVMRIMTQMDWGGAEGFVSFGNYGADVVDDSQFYILIAPQNVQGDSIMPFLEEMVAAAEADGKVLILINPRLADIPSANGVMGVRGRAQRMQFDDSFLHAYHFRLLYISGSYYPIMGALRYMYGGKWEVFARRDLGPKIGQLEKYEVVGLFDTEPDGGKITPCFARG